MEKQQFQTHESNYEVRDLSEISTMEELISDRNSEEVKDFYSTLLKRYRKELTEGIRKKMGYLEEDFDTGEQELVLFTENERIQNLLKQALDQGIIKGSSSHGSDILVDFYRKVADEVFFIEEVPVIIIDQNKYAMTDLQDAGAVSVGDANGNSFGIILFDDKSENSSYEIKRQELQHEFVHISNSILKEKFNLQEEDPKKAKYTWRFIDEVLAYGVNIENFKVLVNGNLISEYIFYVQDSDEDIKEIASIWQEIFQDAIDGGESSLRKLKAFVINQVKKFDDLDVRNENTKADVRSQIFPIEETNLHQALILEQEDIQKNNKRITAIRERLKN
jgi:hypothetical protein